MNFTIPAIGATALASIIAGAAITYSPMPCACESTWQLVYAAAGLPVDFPYKHYSASEVEQGLNRLRKGQVILGTSAYFFDACKKTAPHLLKCVIDTEEAGNHVRGYAIELDIDDRGALKRAHVTTHYAKR